jgi:hypothetical protein
MIAPAEDIAAAHQDTLDASTTGTGDRHPGSRAVGLHSPDLGTGELSIYASEMVRAALSTLIDNSMPTFSAQALIATPQEGESIKGAFHPRQCCLETSVSEEPTDRVLVETMEGG